MTLPRSLVEMLEDVARRARGIDDAGDVLVDEHRHRHEDAHPGAAADRIERRRFGSWRCARAARRGSGPAAPRCTSSRCASDSPISSRPAITTPLGSSRRKPASVTFWVATRSGAIRAPIPRRRDRPARLAGAPPVAAEDARRWPVRARARSARYGSLDGSALGRNLRAERTRRDAGLRLRGGRWPRAPRLARSVRLRSAGSAGSRRPEEEQADQRQREHAGRAPRR